MASASGLRNVEAVDSSITAILPDGLFYRGIPLATLITHATFEEVAFLLWYDRRPSAAELVAFRDAYIMAWNLPPSIDAALVSMPHGVMPLPRLQATLPLLDLVTADTSLLPIQILAQAPAVLARQQQGKPSPLDNDLPLAVQIFQRLGAQALPASVANAALILYADHELAASTFAARITAAAGASLYDGLSAALAVLKGPLHGGSLPAAARLLRSLASATDPEVAIGELVANTRTIPGFGHSVYRTRDPRADHFRTLTEQIIQHDTSHWLDLAMRLETQVFKKRGLYSNVDLYAVTFLHAAGIADDMMIGIFAVARTAGWLAHMLEQRHNNRLIRPRAHYEGQFGRKWE